AGMLDQIRPRGPVADDTTYDLLGAYIQDVIEPIERLELTFGGRFTWAAINADTVDPDPGAGPAFGPIDDDWANAVGSFHALYRVIEEWAVYGGVSQGFRAPNASDLTRFDVARSGELEIPSPGLEPEKYISFEIGTRARTERVQGWTAYHYTLIDGMITRFPTGNVVDGDIEVLKANVGDGFVHGFEVGGAWTFLVTEEHGSMTASAAFAWLEGEGDTCEDGALVRRPLSRIQPATSILTLRWDSPAKRFWVEASVTIADNQDRLAPDDVTDTQRI